MSMETNRQNVYCRSEGGTVFLSKIFINDKTTSAMKNLYILISLLISIFSFAQSVQPPNHNFSSASIRPCHFDSTQMLLQADDWLIYQTIDDTWNGVMDSTLCIGVKDTLGKLIIELEQIDIAKPVFVKSLMNDSTKILLRKDWVYGGEASIEVSDNAFINFSPNCANGFCSGMIIGIEIPDSTGNSTDLRIYSDKAIAGNDRFYELCLVTEYFEENYLKELVYKFKLLGTVGTGLWFSPLSSNLQPAEEWNLSYLDRDTIVPEFSYNPFDSSYNTTLGSIATTNYFYYGGTFLLLYQDTSIYPSVNDISYLELSPEVNDTFPKTINIEMNYSDVLWFQPFSGFRGGLLEGSDSLRHPFNIINNGGTMCFGYGFIELTFEDGNNYIHQPGGEVRFGGKNSCFRFQEGSSLIVDDDTHFIYGKNGMGMLALATGGSIELGKNSTLEINNTISLYELTELYGIDENQQIYMELNEGSSLIFGEDAHLTNKYSIDEKMKLNIYMNGGTLDMSNLSTDEQSIINLIYPVIPNRLIDNVKVFPNPTQGDLNFSMILGKKEMVQFEAFDLTGRLVFSEIQNGVKGNNRFTFTKQFLSKGIYFFKIKSSLGEITKKVVVN